MANPIDDETLANPHPSREELERFAAGSLESSQVTRIEKHIAECQTCCNLLDTNPNDQLIDLLQKSAPPQANANLRLVAGYQILSELGRGGMGVVYLAVQPLLRRQVALKMIARSADSGEQEITRFRREAEATAALRHPYIAQVYDVGELDGQPYIAMELVRGCTLADHLLKRPLRFDEATNLLIKLALAMQHAHANGIIHRDLKPPNILLEQSGADESHQGELLPKIVDFGLAKQIDSSTTVTRTGIIVGTPSYMSPEQAVGNNDLVGPATDVYSLGAILYETLAGRPPFKGASPFETLEQVRTAEPAKPSALRPGLPRDLETICLKCLEKTPGDRYATAEALFDDLSRFKDGHPILAQPAGRVTRAWKWTKRHPTLASLIGVIIVACTSIIAIGTVYNASLRSALKTARDEQIRADGNFQYAFQAVEQMLDRVGFSKLADTPEMECIRAELLADAVSFYSKLLEGQPRADVDSRLQYYGAMARLGKLQWTLGDDTNAVENLQQAIHFQQQLMTEYSHRDDIQHELAISRINCGLVKQDAYEFRQAIELLEAISDSYPQCRRSLAQAINNLANVTESVAEKERLHLSALALRKHLVVDLRSNPDLQYGIGETLHNLGYVYYSTGRHSAAEETYREALQIFENLVHEHDSVTDYHLALAECVTHIASVVHSLGRTDEAITMIEQVTSTRKLLAARFPKIPAMREGVINGLLNEATFLIAIAQFSRASQPAQQAVALASDLSEEFASTEYQFLEATCLTILATSLSGESKTDEARVAFERANATYDKVLAADPNHPTYLTEAGVNCMNYSNLLRGEAPERAASFNDRSIVLLERVFKRSPQRTDFQSYLFNAHGARAGTYEALGNYGEAVASWSRALELAPKERRLEIGLLKSMALARSGEHAQALEAAEALVNDEQANGAVLYNLACLYGLADKARKATNPSASEQSMQDPGELAIELLNRDEVLEFLFVPANRQQLMVDADLESVRTRASFNELLERLVQSAR